MSPYEITWIDIAIAASLVLINGVISFTLRLGLGKSLLIGSIRTIVQLSLIGLILRWVFALDNVFIVLGILLMMTTVAAFSVKGRMPVIYTGLFQDTFIAIFLPSWVILFTGVNIVLHVEPWYKPQYIIPIAGMIIGNVLTGVSLVMDRLLSELKDKQGEIETLITLGATSWEAYEKRAKKAIKAGMMPTINSMMVVGLVSLPGMMTGQVLAGQDPEQAVRYQIMMMFFLTATTGLACILVVFAVFKRIFNKNGVFLSQRLIDIKTS
ncbi:iron export ABC transporter permease subunit FetB [Pelistega sp. NLN82]|uniref:Iron export ABC transporter permease subunit FetB n=1 Tax=Pelistega ratti TaxID=2652177 RepID=A0A6L9Y7I0_9BURK|nr:iron export ABC transporter permease subunit FetB [Pelistega ratti]NEN76349.1 iron export ABC transporter permease subunit FetB [Pelistega ratti]